MKDPCLAHDGEAALILRAALAPHYMTLRRHLAQMAGLLLLAGSRRSETQDGIAVSLAALDQELAEVEAALAEAPGRLPIGALSLHRLEEAARLVRAALRVMTQETLLGPLHPKPDAAAARGRAVQHLQEARALLGSIANDRTGFTMLGFSHACCCSGQGLRADPAA